MYYDTFASRSKLKCPTSDISEFQLVKRHAHMLTTWCRHAFHVFVSIKWQKKKMLPFALTADEKAMIKVSLYKHNV